MCSRIATTAKKFTARENHLDFESKEIQLNLPEIPNCKTLDKGKS